MKNRHILYFHILQEYVLKSFAISSNFQQFAFKPQWTYGLGFTCYVYLNCYPLIVIKRKKKQFAPYLLPKFHPNQNMQLYLAPQPIWEVLLWNPRDGVLSACSLALQMKCSLAVNCKIRHLLDFKIRFLFDGKKRRWCYSFLKT